MFDQNFIYWVDCAYKCSPYFQPDCEIPREVLCSLFDPEDCGFRRMDSLPCLGLNTSTVRNRASFLNRSANPYMYNEF